MPPRPPVDPSATPSERLRHNVPTALSSFVGRTAEIAGLRETLAWSRLVTVVGAGGAGKTRLVRELAAAIVREAPSDGAQPPYPDGVLWADLAPLARGIDVAETLGALLGISPSSGKPVTDALVDALSPQRLLLILDNCEHVIEEAAHVAEALLRGAPHLTLLATSRELLAVDGEVAWQMPGLARWEPEDGDVRLNATTALGFDAIHLFVERARASSPAFALTDANAVSVALICARLDGLPLALELAAAAVPLLGVEGLVARLDDAIAVLARGRRTALPRHRTLRAVLDWSYELLGDRERALLRRLSVFRGSFTLDDVESVCAASPGPDEPDVEILPTLGRLVELSLMEVREEGGVASYRLLETVRQYGSALLRASPHEGAVRARHAQWVAEVAEREEPSTFSAARGRTVARLRGSVEEIRAALQWAVGPSGDPLLAVRIAGALGWYWISAHPWGEARALLHATLAVADAQGIADDARPLDERVALGRMMYPILGLAYFAGDTEEMLAISARELRLWDSVDADHALTDAQQLTAARGRTLCLQLTGLAYALRGEELLARPVMDRCIEVAEASGDRWLLAVMLMRRALAHHILGDYAAAHADFAASVPRLREMGEHWFLSLALEGMAMNALAAGDLSGAGAYAHESVIVLRPEPDAWFISRSLDAIAVILLARCRADGSAAHALLDCATVAARLMGAAAGLRRRCGAGIIGPDVERHAITTAELRALIGDAAYAEAIASGEGLTLGQVFEMMARDPVVAALARPAEAPASLIRTAEPDDLPRPLEVSLLGGVSIRDDGRALAAESMPTGKVLELLIFLLLHPGATKDDVALALWPDASAAQVRNIFHVTLHHLRRALGSTRWITFERGVYRIEREPEPGRRLLSDVDALLDANVRLRTMVRERAVPSVDSLTELKRALDGNRGTLAKGALREEWLVPHDDRLQAAWSDAMEALALLAHRRADHDITCATLEALLAREPLRENAHRLYLETLAARGESARALAHYEKLTDLLRREVGAKPARETRELAERLRARA